MKQTKIVDQKCCQWRTIPVYFKQI